MTAPARLPVLLSPERDLASLAASLRTPSEGAPSSPLSFRRPTSATMACSSTTILPSALHNTQGNSAATRRIHCVRRFGRGRGSRGRCAPRLCSNFNVYLGVRLVVRKRCLALSRRCEMGSSWCGSRNARDRRCSKPRPVGSTARSMRSRPGPFAAAEPREQLGRCARGCPTLDRKSRVPPVARSQRRGRPRRYARVAGCRCAGRSS